MTKFRRYIEENGINDIRGITTEHLNGYIDSLKDKNFKAATISRNIASIKAMPILAPLLFAVIRLEP